MHIITSINMRGNSSISNNTRSNSKVVTTDDSKWKIFPSSLETQERSASTGSTISTGGHNIKEMLLSPIAACRSPSSVTEMNHIVTSSAAVGCCTPPHSAPSSPPASPKHQQHNKKSNNKRFPVESSSVCPNGRKKALYRNRTSPPHYNKNSMPRTHSSPSLSSSHAAVYGIEEEEEQSNSQTTPSSSSEVLIGENLLDKAALDSCNSWNDAESLYSFSSRDHLLDIHNNNLNRAAISQHQPPRPHQSSCSSSSYDCNYKFSQEKAYEEFGVERKLIDKNIMGSSSSSKTQGGKKKKHWIRLRQSVLSSHSPQVTLPRKPSLSSLKKPTGSSSSSLNLPPSGKSSTTQKSTTTRAVRKSSAPPTYFNVDVSRDYNRVPREENDGHYSVGYYSAPIEMELRPDRSLSQMGMEVTEEDYCIEGEYMSRQFQKQPQQQHNVSGCTSNQRKGSKKPSESVFSMKELAKGLEGSARSKSCSPKVIKTKVLSALRRVGSGDNVTKDASSGTKKKIPHQIAITVTPSSSEDAADDRLSLDELKMLYRWQKARCQKDMNQFSSSVSCNADDDCTHVETAITKTVMSEDGMSITSSVGDRTVSVDNRRSSIKRQLNRQVSF